MEIWPVEGPWSGRLAVCSRPRAGWFLDDDLRELRDAGYHVLISALTPEEVVRSELERVPAACLEFNLDFHHFPVGNLQVAAPDIAHPRLLDWQERLGAGQSLAVHCWASVGRSPTIAAALMVMSGIPAEDAWIRLEAARGRLVPDTWEQRKWAAAWAANTSLAPESPIVNRELR